MLKRFLPIILLSFVNVIGFTLLIPLLPELVSEYVEPQHVGIMYGVLLSSYALFQFLGSPILGSLSDKYGRKPVLFISQLGTLLSWVIFGIGLLLPNIPVFGLSLPLLVIAFSRVVDGITGGNISVAQAWISDVTSREEKTRAFALMGGIFGFGFLIGPALGGFTSTTELGYLGSILVAFIISLITLALIYWQLPESLPPEKRDPDFEFTLWQEINIWKQLQKFQANKLVFSLLILRIFYALVFASYTTIIILFLQEEFALTPTTLGLVLSLIGVFSIFNQIVITGRLSDRFGDLSTLFISIGLIGASLVMIPLIPLQVFWGGINVSLVLFILNSYLVNLGLSVGQPVFQSLVTNSVADHRQGSVMGLDESLLAIGRGISPVAAGGLYGVLGNGFFFFLSAFLIIPYVIAWSLGRFRQ